MHRLTRRMEVRLFSLLALAAVACTTAPPTAEARRGRRAKKLPGIALDKNHVVGKPHRLGKLTVFPVYAKKQQKLGKFVTLQEAVSKGVASVTEMGANARVSTIVVDNRGKHPILILGGTVILGGKQDRQIGEDTIAGPTSKTKVKVFCVEQGRWNAVRRGRATSGKFKVLEVLATRTVRNAGQYKVNQSKVWQNVAKYNKKAGKRSATSSLLVTVNDKTIKKRRGRITKQALRHLDRLRHKKHVVGLAFAVAGKLSSVRWFADHGIYRRFRTILINTAATEAIVAKKPKKRRLAKARDVKVFLAKLRTARRTRTDKRAYNRNMVFADEAAGAYKSKAYYRAKRRARGRRAPRARPARMYAPVTVDHSAK